MGGFEYNGRTKILICESTRFFSSAESQTIENAPTRSPYRPLISSVPWIRTMDSENYHILRETLGQAESMPFPYEMPYGEGISICVTAGEPLVCHIKERVMLLFFDDLANLLPLCFRRIDSSRIVGACMKQNDATFRSRLKICYHAIEVQPDSVLVVVSILFDLKSGVFEDWSMVCPARCWDEYLFVAWVKARQKFAPNSQSPGARNGLGYGHSIFLNGGGTRAISQHSCGFGERWDTGYSSVLFVQARFDNFLLSCFNGR